MKKILIILGHNNMERSKVNKAMIEQAKTLDNVTVIDLYQRYGGSKVGDMDKKKIEEDREKMIASDIIINQFPFHWYTSPPMTDNWREYALGWNWAFGNKFALENKITTVAYTAGEVAEDYTKKGRSIYDSDEFIKRFEAAAKYCKMKWIKNFKVVGASHMEQDVIEKEASRYKDWLEKISK